MGPNGEKLDFVSPSGFEIQSHFDYKTSKTKLYSVRDLKCYLNEKNLIRDYRVLKCTLEAPQNQSIVSMSFKMILRYDCRLEIS